MADVNPIAKAFGILRDTFFTGDNNNLLKHVCPPTLGGGPLDPVSVVPPDRVLERGLLVGFDLPLPPLVAARVGSNTLRMWIIENGLAADTPADPKRAYPSPLIRTRQGDLIHVEVKGKGGTHTIHWHGIEPTPVNDGVGKHSFEISGNFIYQFQTNEAGTYFYHCHKNTTLHFHMGLWGGLIVDPPNPNIPGDNDLSVGFPFDFDGLTAPYTAGGPGYAAGRRAFFGLSTGDFIPYHQEKIWAVDSLDSFWHQLNPNHDLNMQKCNANDPNAPGNFYQFGSGDFELNTFNPDVFTVSGVVLDSPQLVRPFSGTINHPAIAINAQQGEIVLLRYINASYTIQELRLPVPATVIAWDGHPLGVGPAGGFHAFSTPYTVPAGNPIRTTSARRMDIIIDTRSLPTGTSNATIRLYDWIKGVVPAGLFAETSIPVTINGAAPNTDIITVTRAQFNPRNRRLQVRATSANGLPMSAQVFADGVQIGPVDGYPLVNGRLNQVLPGALTPTRVVVNTAQGTSGDVPIVVR
jgi:hypothetical protein